MKRRIDNHAAAVALHHLPGGCGKTCMQRRRRPSHPPDYSKWLRLGIGAAAIIVVVLVTVLVWIPSRFVFLAGIIALGSAVRIWIYRDHLVQRN